MSKAKGSRPKAGTLKPTQRPANNSRKPKAAANPASTGGSGVSFENRSQAVRLLHMCLGSRSPGIEEGWRIVELRFQAGAHGVQTDDLVCTIENQIGTRKKVFMQMKSGLTAGKTSKAFGDAIGGAWFDYQNPTIFNRAQDQVVIVSDKTGMSGLEGMAFICSSARFTLTTEEWIQKITAEGVGNKKKRDALDAVKHVIRECLEGREPTDDEIKEFLSKIDFIFHDLEKDGTAEHITYINEISGSIFKATMQEPNAEATWARLVTACMQLNSMAGAVNLDSLPALLGDELARAFAFVRRFNTHPGQSQYEFSTVMLAASLAATPGAPTALQAITHGNGAADTIPTARDSSANKLISRSLDHIYGKLRSCQYRDALADLERLGEDLGSFDSHQRARWFLMRGTCSWHLTSEKEASADFLKAATLCSDDDKIAAAGVRGYLLSNELESARQAADAALEQFPQSLSVWIAAKNVDIREGKPIREDGIPSQHRHEADALNIVAWGLRQSGNISTASDLSRRAAALPTANFFTREAAVTLTLEELASNPLSSAFRSISANESQKLTEVATLFEPKSERLWPVQGTSSQIQAVANLGFVYILLNRQDEALDLIRNARDRGIDDASFIRIEMEAYSRNGDLPAAIRAGESSLESGPLESIMMFAQVAAESDDVLRLERALSAVEKLPNATVYDLDAIRALRWHALSAAGKRDEVLAEISKIDFNECTSVPLLIQANHESRTSGDTDSSERILNRLFDLITDVSSPGERYMLARALIAAARLEDAIVVLRQLVRNDAHGQVGNDLLYCLIQVGAYEDAKSYFEKWPVAWLSDESCRRLALQLSQEAGDWGLFKRVAQASLDAGPELAYNWILRLISASRESPEELELVVASIPSSLTGTCQEIAQIATTEIINGHADTGVKRLYRMRRQSMTDIEAAASHLSAHLLTAERLPLLDAKSECVGPGTFFTVVDEQGQAYTRAIDPVDMGGLPESGDFRAAGSDQVAPFLGKKVGDEVIISAPFAADRTLRIEQIGSSYLLLVQSSSQLLKESFASPSFLSVVSVPEDAEGNADVEALRSQFRDQIKKSGESARSMFSTYASHPMTIGMLSWALGKSLFDLITLWPHEDAELFVGGSSLESRKKEGKIISEGTKKFVIDAATLIELGRLQCLHLLKGIPKPHCSTKTYDLLRGELEGAKRFRASGTAVEHEGNLAVIEISDEEWARRVELLEEVVRATEQCCELLPSYGPMDWKRVPPELRKAVSTEEASVLLLALQLDAHILCLDERLKLLGSVCNLRGIGVQALMAHCRDTGLMDAHSYSMAVLRSFLSGRSHTSLSSMDLLAGLYQGNGFTDRLLSEFQADIADPRIDISSAITVSLGLIALLCCTRNIQYGYTLEIAYVLFSGIFRHPDFKPSTAALIKYSLENAPGISGRPDSARNLLQKVVDEAFSQSKSVARPVKLRGFVSYSFNPPFLNSGLKQDDLISQVNEAEIKAADTNKGDSGSDGGLTSGRDSGVM